MKHTNQTILVSALVAGLSFYGAGMRTSYGASVGCGAVLTSDTTLESDLDCATPAALIIGADNITLNLNGHTLRSLDGLGVGVDITGHHGVTVKNGVIDQFQEAIRAQEASTLTLWNLTIPSISGTGIIPGHFGIVGAIHILGGTRVKIHDSSITAGPSIISPGVFGPDAILLESVSDVSISNIDVEGGFSGVNFSSCGDELWCATPMEDQPPSTGEVKNSVFADNFIGVLLFNAADITIKENVISGADQGIRAGTVDVLSPAHVKIVGNELFGNNYAIESWLVPTVSDLDGSIVGCAIKGNNIHENNGGIQLVNGQDCKLSENIVENNARFGINLDTGCANNVISQNLVADNGFRGIVLTWGNHHNRISDNAVLNNGVEGITLFLGMNTGNRITDNVATGNGVWDLFHNDESTPNFWNDNTYETKSGVDIP